MGTMLPVVNVDEEPGKKFFFDERLCELRNISNPHDSIRLNDFEVAYFKAKANRAKNKK